MLRDIQNDDLDTIVKKVKAREETFKQLEAVSNLGSWEIDLISNESIWSDQSYLIYGLDKETTEPNLELFFSLLLPEYVEKAKETLEEIMTTGEVGTFECRARRTDGNIVDLLLNGQVTFDKNNLPIKLIGTTQNITEQVSLKRHTDELSKLIEYSSNEIYIIDKDNYNYIYVNKGARDALGYTADELLTMNIFITNPYLSMEKATLLKEQYERSGNGILNRTIHKRKNGELYHVQSYIHAMNYNGIDSFVIFDIDITETVKLEEELSHQANHDSLTKLPNRALFQDRLTQTIASAQRNNGQFALLFIDLDQFKKINDSLGHNIGDDVLIHVASRLEKSLREQDSLARLGGDEFTVILKNIKNIQGASKVAKKIIDSMKEPILTNNHSLYVSSSIGISIYPKDATTQADLIKYADTAMYKAKDRGRDNFQFYSSHMTELALKRIELESSLRVAIKEEELHVYFQPQFDLKNNNIIGMEALVRWQHPTLGLILPDHFLPTAKDTDLVLEIDKLVMIKAMKQFALWHCDDLNPGTLALNLTMRQLDKKNFIKNLLNTMESLDFKPQWLELEITEGEVMKNAEASIEKLNQINEIGVDLAIDDFGTGYSSLAYLKKLPLDRLKIDQSFVKEIPHNDDDSSIIKAIIALGKSLNLGLTAEGVETKEQKEFLTEHGCCSIQGFYSARPMTITDMTKLLRDKKVA